MISFTTSTSLGGGLIGCLVSSQLQAQELSSMDKLGNGSATPVAYFKVTRSPPLLFFLVMEALNGLFRWVDQNGLLSSLRAPAIKHHLSLYANDLVIFLSPEAKDIRLAWDILEFFIGASGLHTNLTKC
jgi:hypothetical protein